MMNRNRTLKKPIAVLLSLLMMLSVFTGLTAFAADTADLAAALEEATTWYGKIRSTYFGYNNPELIDPLRDAISTANGLDDAASQEDLTAAVAALWEATGNAVLAYGIQQAEYYASIEAEYPEIAATLKAALDDATAVQENSAATAQEKLEAGKAALLAQNKAAFEVEKAGAIKRLQESLKPTDSEICQQIVNEAVAAIGALAYDESKDYFDNRDAVSSMERTASDALEAQQAAEYDASVTWTLLPTSADGLENGDLYFNLDALEAARAALFAAQDLFDLIPANNYGAAGLEALKRQYPDQWAEAYQQVIEEKHLLYADGKLHIGGEVYTPEEYFAPEEFGGYVYDANDIFVELMATVRPDLVSVSPWSTQFNQSKLEEIGKTYVQEAYETEYAQAVASGAQRASEQIAALRAMDWYLNTTDYSAAKAMQNGEIVSFTDITIVYEVLYTLTEFGLTWTPVKVVEETAGLENGDYYILRSALESNPQLAYMINGLTILINVGAAETSPFQYEIQMASPYGGPAETYDFPMYDSRMPFTAFLKENVLLYHPEHAFGDWEYADAENHSRTCSICGEAETEGHNVIVKGAGDATCGNEGYTGDKYCSVCGQKLSEGEIIPATGNHTTEIRNAKEATATEDGYTGDEVCTVCGKTIKTGEVIPATGDNTPDEPDDGDACPYCGKHHAKKWVLIVHLVLWFLCKAFRIVRK